MSGLTWFIITFLLTEELPTLAFCGRVKIELDLNDTYFCRSNHIEFVQRIFFLKIKFTYHEKLNYLQNNV